MQACVLHAVGDLRCESVETPAPGENKALVRVGACGVCGSDIPRVFRTGTYRFPLIPGHEFAGEVVAVGPSTDPALVGTRVTVFPLLPCMRCAMCRTGHYALCADYDYLGSRSNGAFAEFVIAPIWNLLPVPEGVTFEEAAMTEPAAVALHALRRAEHSPRDSVLIFGAGPVGVLVALWARALGSEHVLLADIDERKLDFARGLGFDRLCNVRTHRLSDFLRDLLPDGAAITVEASGSAAAFGQCMEAAAPFGRVVLLGNPEGAMTLEKQTYWAILRKELRVVGTWNSSYQPTGRDEWKQALECMKSGALNVKPLITHRVGLSELPAALAMIRDRSVFSNKVMFVR